MSFGLFYIYSFKALVKTLNNLVPNISKCFCFFLVYRSGKGWILLTHRKPRLKHLICYSLNSSGSWYCPWTDCRAWSGATASDQAPKARDVPSRERECPQGSMRHYQVQLLREIGSWRHLVADLLLNKDNFPEFDKDFPVKVFKDTIGAFLEERKLEN